MEEVVTAAQAEGRIAGILLDDGETEQRFSLGGYDSSPGTLAPCSGGCCSTLGWASRRPRRPRPSETEGSPHGPTPADRRPFGMLIAEADDQFLLVGQGIGLDFSCGADVVEVDSVEEGRFESGRWVPGRVLNGDERLFLLPGDDIGVVRIRLLRLPSPTAKDSE